ncbi:MAG: DUF4091 domain-containing protein [Planctomycetota bacterium]|nr:MAG: DUF4091 domain-containing protein [Planctomycetota bacterium]
MWAGVDNIRVWAVPDSVMVFPDTSEEAENEVYSDSDRTIRLNSAINEVVSFQLVFASSLAPTSVWGVTVADLRHQEQVIPAERVRLYRQERIPVNDYPVWYLRHTPNLREAREFPDPLIPFTAPRGSLPIEVEPGRCQAVWIEIHVPMGTEPGVYRSKLRVTTQSGLIHEKKLLLNVWPFALPQTRHLAVIAGIETSKVLRHCLEVEGMPYVPSQLDFQDPAYQRAADILDGTCRLLHEHRLNPIMLDIYPIRRVGAGVELELDWADFDRIVASVLDGSAYPNREAASAWPMPISNRQPSPEAYGGWGSSVYENMLIDYLGQCVTHFEQKGWLDAHFVNIPVPGPSRGEQYQQFQRLGQLVGRVDKRLNLLCQLAPHSMEPYGYLKDPFIDVSPLVDIWCPPASMMDIDEISRQSAAGKRCWFWPDRPPYAGSLSIIAPSDHAVSLAWQAYRFACDGIMLRKINDWPDDGRVGNAGSEGALIWPGKDYGLDRPIPSIRLKRLMRGIQDYEYLWLLERNRRPGIAKLIATDLFSYGGTGCIGEHFLDGRSGGWVTDTGPWSLARKLIGQEVVEAIQERGSESDEGMPESVSRFEQQIEWARLIKSVRQMRIQVEGIRVSIAPEDAMTPLSIEAAVALFNTTRQPFNGRLAFASTEEEWSVDESTVQIDGLEPLRGSRHVVRAKARSVQANLEGVVPIRIILSDKSGSVDRVDGRLCVLSSYRVNTPMVIDGRLNDWPLGTTNVAGDFVLVGALDVPKHHRASPDRASQMTTVFVCNDDNNLYIAFNCEDDRMQDREILRTNYVRYEDLWPVGEDLVEVVLDPVNAAADAGDLLHIVVKANGAVVTERGAPCLSKVADHGEWPADVIAAIDDKSHPNRWTVEIRIPLESLGEKAMVLGINFARLNARLGEYSSWSGARRYLYSPVSLGNMRLGQ